MADNVARQQQKRKAQKLVHYFIKKTREFFLQRDYFSGLEYSSYALEKMTVLSAKNKRGELSLNQCRHDALTFAKLCDLALEHEDEARALFEYYEVLKSQNTPNPHLMLDELLDSLYENLNKMADVFSYFSAGNTDYLDGVTLRDFRRISAQMGFKRAFETLMFSSRIILQNREEFLSFMRDLIQNDFLKIALMYFENAPTSTQLDTEFTNLYQILLQKISQSKSDDNSVSP